MAIYVAEVEVTYHLLVEVEAASPDEARAKASDPDSFGDAEVVPGTESHWVIDVERR